MVPQVDRIRKGVLILFPMCYAYFLRYYKDKSPHAQEKGPLEKTLSEAGGKR